MIDWKSIDTAPEGVEVGTMIADGNGVRNQQTLIQAAKKLVDGNNPPDDIVSVSVAGKFNGWDTFKIRRAIALVCKLAKQ